ncbi:hypothetical protein D1007_60445 [Hordeum vulgare]|nr:hypothetical protein D1007_60445 [Hordeum vulgare]
MPMCMGEVIVIQGADQDAKQGCDGATRVIRVDWDSVQLEDTTILVIAPMADSEMANFFGIPLDPVDDQDAEERGKSSLPNDSNIDACEDVDGQLMKDVADDIDDAHNDELVSVRKRGGQPLLVEDCSATKNARINGCRKKRSFGRSVQDEPNLDDVVVQNETNLDDVVEQNETNLDDVRVQNEQHLDEVHNEEDLDVAQNEQTEQNVVQTRTEVDPADVQTEPILEVVFQIEADVGVVVQNKPHLDVVVPTKAVLDGPVNKTKKLSELARCRTRRRINKCQEK